LSPTVWSTKGPSTVVSPSSSMMDNVLIVVDDLEAAKAFFAELGTGDAAMNEMTNDRPEAGTRTSVSFYEAPVDIRS